MAGRYEITPGAAMMPLFEEEAPNLIPEAVMSGMREGGSIPGALVMLQINGYAKNVRKFYRYGRDKYTIGLPKGYRRLADVSYENLRAAAQEEARRHLSEEASRFQVITDNIYSDGVALYDVWLQAWNAMNAAEIAMDKAVDAAFAQYYVWLAADNAANAQYDVALAAWYVYADLVNNQGSPQPETDIAFNTFKREETEYYRLRDISDTEEAEFHRLETIAEGKQDDYAEAVIANDKAEDEFHEKESEYEHAQGLTDILVDAAKTATIDELEYSAIVREPSNYLKAWESIYEDDYFQSIGFEDISGSEASTNQIIGYYPKIFIEEIYVPPILWSSPSNDFNSYITYRFEEKDGRVWFHKVSVPFWEHGILGLGLELVDILEVRYNLNEINHGDNNWFVWQYDINTNIYPDISPQGKYSDDAFYTAFLPIVRIARAGERLETKKDNDGEYIDEEGHTADVLLKKIQVDMFGLQDQIADAPNASDIDDSFVGFFCPFISEVQRTLQYNFQMFLALREDIGVYDEGLYGDSHATGSGFSILEQDVLYKSKGYDTKPWTFNQLQMFVNGDAATFKAFSEFDYQVDLNEGGVFTAGEGAGEIIFIRSFYNLRTGYIYKEEFVGKIGKIGFITQEVEDSWPYNNEALKVPGGGVGYITFHMQTEENVYTMLRVHFPRTSFQNLYEGEGTTVPQVYFLNYDLNSSNAGDVGIESKDFMVSPLNYDVLRKFSGLSEEKVYYDSLRLMIFSVHVEYIPGWKTFLMALVYIIIVLVMIITQQWYLLAVFIVVTAVTKIITEILQSVLSAEAAAKGSLGLGIALSILTLGAGAANLVVNLVNLAFQLIGVVTQLISAINSIKLLDVLSDITDLTELQLLEDEQLEEAKDLLGQAARFDPLMVGGLYDAYETPSQYISNRLMAQPMLEIITLTHRFVDDSLTLPEIKYEEQEFTTGTPAFGKFPELMEI